MMSNDGANVMITNVSDRELALQQAPTDEKDHRAKLHFNIGMLILKDFDA